MGANSVIVAMSPDAGPSVTVTTPVVALGLRFGQLSVGTVPVEMTWEHVCPPLLPQV